MVSHCCSTWFDPNFPISFLPKIIIMYYNITTKTAQSYPHEIFSCLFIMYCVNGKTRSSLLIESNDSMILILILQLTYRDSVLSSDTRLHVNPIHFLVQCAVCQQLLGNLIQSKYYKFHHQTCSKHIYGTSTTPFSYTESAGNVSLTSFGTSHVEVSGLTRAPSTHVQCF